MLRKAYSLVEVVCALAITSLIFWAMLTFFSAIMTEQSRPVITYGGRNYTLAPVLEDSGDGVVKTGLFSALDLHQELLRQARLADTIAVFGFAENPPNYPSLPSVIRPDSAPMVLSVTTPRAFANSAEVRNAMVGATAEDASNLNSARCFDLVMVRGLTDITCLVHVRVYEGSGIAYEGQAAVLYSTEMKTREPGVNSWTTIAYNFWIPKVEDTWGRNVGATHLWYRHDQATAWWQRSEPAGYQLVFPDPYLLSVVAASQDGVMRPATSRFSLFLPFSPSQ